MIGIPVNPKTVAHMLFSGYFAPRGERYANTETLARLEQIADVWEISDMIEKHTRNLQLDHCWVVLFNNGGKLHICGVYETSRERSLSDARIPAAFQYSNDNSWQNENNYYCICIA